ncbi:hypothetical protein F5Y18DRAFT_436106 [Xylariaceae sp. FL1019]|nr:hypothetical protein F5Y18DRAFT_436106 [Xylariaceae sp. FL1019]
MARELQAQFSGGGGDRQGRKRRRGQGQNSGGYARDLDRNGGPHTSTNLGVFRAPMSSARPPVQQVNPTMGVPRNSYAQPAYYGRLVESNSPGFKLSSFAIYAIEFAPRQTTSVSVTQPTSAANQREFSDNGTESLRAQEGQTSNGPNAHPATRSIARPAAGTVARPVVRSTSPMDTREDYPPAQPSRYLTQREMQPEERTYDDDGSERIYPLGTGTVRKNSRKPLLQRSKTPVN